MYIWFIISTVKIACTKRSLGKKEILFIKVEEGSDKPYTVWQRGVFIRAGGSDRIEEKYERVAKKLCRTGSRTHEDAWRAFCDLGC